MVAVAFLWWWVGRVAYCVFRIPYCVLRMGYILPSASVFVNRLRWVAEQVDLLAAVGGDVDLEGGCGAVAR